MSTTRTYTIWCDWKPPSGATGFCSHHVEGGSLLEARALARTSGWQLALRRKSGPPIEGPDYCSVHKTVKPRQ